MSAELSAPSWLCCDLAGALRHAAEADTLHNLLGAMTPDRGDRFEALLFLYDLDRSDLAVVELVGRLEQDWLRDLEQGIVSDGALERAALRALLASRAPSASLDPYSVETGCRPT